MAGGLRGQSDAGVSSSGAGSREAPAESDEGISSTLVPYKFVGKASSYRWTIRGLQGAAARHACPERLYSEPFEVSGVPWRVLVFPNGNGVRSLSLYLDLANAHALPRGWSCVAGFAFTVVNRADGASITNQTEKLFLLGVQDWGFREFMPLRTLYDTSEGYITQDDTLVIEATVAVTPPQGADLDDDSGDDADLPQGARAAPYVGLANQGATCYLNSLLQTFFHLPFLRQKVYEVPVGDGYDPPLGDDVGDDAITPTNAVVLPKNATAQKDRERDVIFALQQVFYHLQFTSRPVSTRELTQSFGWTGSDTFRQHDVHELTRVMCDRIEERMKSTPCAGALDALFKGVAANVIECSEIDYRSSTEEPFYDLQLNVSGCPTLESALDQAVAAEVLEGENAYAVDGHGLQPATRRCVFRKLPPVLMLHLKRFEFDMSTNRQTKVNQRQEFPLQLDVSRYLSSQSEPDAASYLLHAVLVHSGDVSGGHYYAFVRPDMLKGGPTAQWYRFDDERVVPVSERDAVEENFGGDYGGGHLPRYASAYVLTYIRQRDMCWVIPSPATAPEVPASVHRRFGRSARRELRRNVAEAHLVVMVKVLGDKDVGASPSGGPLDFSAVEAVKVQRRGQLASLLFHVEETLGLSRARAGGSPDGFAHLWVWRCSELVNGTTRPRLLVDAREDRTIESVFCLPAHMTHPLLLYAHAAPPAPGGRNPHRAAARAAVQAAPLAAPSAVLLFVKHFAPDRDPPLRSLGRTFVRPSTTTGELWQRLADDGGCDLPPGCPSAFEEVRPGVLEPLPLDMAVGAAELTHGDVVIYSSEERSPTGPPPGRSRCVEWCQEQAMLCDVRMCPCDQPDLVAATLRLSWRATVAEVRKELLGRLPQLGDRESGGTVEIFAQNADYQPQVIPLPLQQTLAAALSVGWNRQRRTLYFAARPCAPQDAPAAAPAEQDTATDGAEAKTVISVQVISPTHGEVQETLKVVAHAGATVGALKARLIEEHRVLGDTAACGFEPQPPEPAAAPSAPEPAANPPISPPTRPAAVPTQYVVVRADSSPQRVVAQRTAPSILPISPPHAVVAHPRKDGAAWPRGAAGRAPQHPYHERLRLYEVSEKFHCITQCLWDPDETIPAPSIGLALYCEDGGGDGQVDLLYHGASLRFAPGLSSLQPYQAAFSLLQRGTQLDLSSKPERFVLQVLRFDPLPSPPDGKARKAADEPDAADAEVVQPHSPPWLVSVHSNDTVRDLRRRILADRPMPQVLKEYIAGKPKQQPAAAIHVVREFNRCLRQPLADSARVVSVLSANVCGRLTPSLAVAHPTVDVLRHDRRTGTAVAIRR
eukprot:TRINITY_DN55634_c0_g1_i1.p1 TRINITY_DN55634_c0_g1~~TRINITY_DN55634_c0_g1_i1.p1  ORF type:complete len:1363 (+),score=410.57 TRINITY_DN55634_c0_g1_i1:107-4090(+)